MIMNLLKYILLIFIINECKTYNLNSSIIIKTKSGDIQGYLDKDAYGNEFYSFKGIPYAEAPVGKLRFMPTKLLENWEFINASTYGSACPQRSFFGIVGDENCLFLNIYTKSLKNNTPVLFYIHGGGFEEDDSYERYGPGWIVQEDVMLITFEYRLSSLGNFPYITEKLKIHGNQALKDQLLALKWVRNNINYFGGNPNQVVISGESAGAVYASYHLLSERSHGLFQGAILMSASSENFWGFAKEPVYHDIKTLKKAFGFNEIDDKEFFNYLQNIDYKQFLKIMFDFQAPTKKNYNQKLFCPTIEENHPNAFLTKHPHDLLKNRKINDVPVIIGFNKDEGVIFTSLQMIELPENFTDENNYAEFVPPNLKDVLIESGKSNKINSIGKKIRWYYFGNRPINNNTVDKIKYFSEVVFINDIIRMATMLKDFKTTSTYLYEFGAYTRMNFIQHLVKIVTNSTSNFDFNGYTSHTDMFGYLFTNNFSIPVDDKSSKIINTIVTLWTNFVKTLNPNLPKPAKLLKHHWYPMSVHSRHIDYLKIRNDKAVMCTDPKSFELMFWINLLQCEF